MTTLLEFLRYPLAHGLLHALGWTLLHFCWQGAVVAVVLWCVLKLLAPRSSRARYGTACFALLLLVAMPLITFAHLAAVEYQMRATVDGSVMTIGPDFVLQAGMGDAAMPWTMRMAIALDHSMPWLLAAWLVGVLFFVVRLNFGLVVARRLKSAGTHAPSAELLERFDALRFRLGVERVVGLLHSARVQVPTVIGWLRPVVLIPASCLTGLSTEQIEAIFCHELAHIRRHDYLVSVFQSVAEALLFYHPAVWWISKQVRRERECCCDQVAVANGGDVLAYARALSYLEERRASFPEFVLGANGGVLTMRIKRLLGCREDAPVSQFAAFTLLALMLAVAGSYVATVAKAQPKIAPSTVAGDFAATAPSGLDEGRVVVTDAAPSKFTGLTIRTIDYSRFDSITLSQVTERFSKEEIGLDPGMPYDPARIAHAVAVLKTMLTEHGHPYATVTVAAEAIPPAAVGVLFKVKEGPKAKPGEPFSYGAAATPVSYTLGQNESSPTQADGAIAGIIVDPTGALVPRANVKSVNTDTGQTMAKVTDNTGSYLLSPLPPGPYNVEVEAKGFYRLLQENIQVRAGQTFGLNLKLGIGAENTNLTVTGKPLPSAPPPPPVVVTAPKPGLPQRVSAGTMAGLAISQPQPIYPDEAKAGHVQGVVVLKARISKTGEIENVQVVSGPPPLLVNAIDAVRQWKYKPYTLNGEPTEVQTTININFTLDDLAASSAPNASAANTDPMVRKIGGNVSSPVVIYTVAPEFSEQARKAKFMGVVLVNMIVDQYGRPQNVHVLRGVGMGLDEKAVEAVRQYKFRPAMEDGKPVPVELNAEVNFQIFDKPQPKVAASPNPPPTTEASSPLQVASFDYDGVPVRKVGGGVTAPVPIQVSNPDYTKEARKAKLKGIVLVGLIVDAQGLPQNVHVTRGIGMGLDEKAVEAVKQYKFRPAMSDGKPVPVELNIEVNFQIF